MRKKRGGGKGFEAGTGKTGKRRIDKKRSDRIVNGMRTRSISYSKPWVAPTSRSHCACVLLCSKWRERHEAGTGKTEKRGSDK